LTKPVPQLVLKNEEQMGYITQLNNSVSQLNTINQSLEDEIKRQNETIGELRKQLDSMQALASSTQKVTIKTH
jgi:predicted RNase H-like nuclease (RuvC/YqgF family)